MMDDEMPVPVYLDMMNELEEKEIHVAEKHFR